MRWGPSKTARGTTVQSALPTGVRAVRANGLTVRGVVVAVYVYDTSATELFQNQNVQVNDIYVDVLIYGRHNTVLPRVLWTKARSGLHEGDISLPRAATLDTSGGDLNVATAKPQAMDGDHVIVGFLEDDLAQPYVVSSLNHPSSDIGKSDSDPLGQRTRLVAADGNPRLWKHRGSAFGIDTDGNFILDTRTGHGGEYQADGAEPSATQNGSNGNLTATIQPGATVAVTGFEGLNIQNTGNTALDTNGTVGLGTGASHPLVYGDTYQTDQGIKNQTIITAATAAVSAISSATGTVGTPVQNAAAIVALGTALSTFISAVQTALTQYDAAISAQLSPDVTTK